MWFSRLFWKLFLSYAAVIMLTLAAVGWLQSQRQERLIVDQLRRRLRDSAVLADRLFADCFRERRDAMVQRELVRLGRRCGVRFTLVAADGTVLGDSDHDPATMENHRDRPELLAARRRGTGEAERTSPTLGIPMMYFAQRVGPQQELLGFVRTALPLTTVREQVAAFERVIWTAGATGAAAALVLTWFVVRRIIGPVSTLRRAADRIRQGRFDQSVDIPRRDEFGLLAAAFNQMSARLEEQFQSLAAQRHELEETAGLLRTVLQTMRDGVVAVDGDQRVLYANDASHRLLGVSVPLPAGGRLWELVREPAMRELAERARRSSEMQRGELVVERTGRTLSLFAAPLAGARPGGVVLVLSDITELRRLETVRRDFVSNVSHELKTPLTSIQAFAETLLAGAIDDAENNRRFLQYILQHADRLRALINDLLSLAQIESGEATMQREPVDLAAMLAECVGQFQAAAQKAGLRLRFDTPPDGLMVCADADGLHSIFANLIDNAVKYTPEGGTVSVRAELAGEQVRVQVADTGIGIAPEHQNRVFERFYRVDKARSRELGGTGLGLALVKHWAQAFGGRVELKSEVGKGTVLSVWLPLAEPAEGDTS